MISTRPCTSTKKISFSLLKNTFSAESSCLKIQVAKTEDFWRLAFHDKTTRRDLPIPPPNSFLGEDLAQPPLSFTTTRDPAPKRTWNQIAPQFLEGIARICWDMGAARWAQRS